MIYGRCSGCRKNRLFVRRRKYRTKGVGEITSEGQQCRACFRAVTALVRKMDAPEA